MSGSKLSPNDEAAVASAFERLHALGDSEREHELNRLAPRIATRVQSLLDHASAAEEDDFLASPVAGHGLAIDAVAAVVPRQLRQIGPFHLAEMIGRGGMGTVYRAVQERPKRTVALKLLRPDVIDAATRRRFLEEAEILGALSHPGIARIYSAGEHDGLPYFAMEYIRDGAPITEFAAARGLSIRERLALFDQVCDAVGFGHEHGVVHRDLKPSNILIDANGHPAVIDFGIARATFGPAAVTTETMHSAFGTLAYACPEQLEARAGIPDVRGDVYSLGVVLYELLTGRRAFDLAESSYVDAIRAIQRTAVARPSSVEPALRGDLEHIVLKAMAPEPERRYPSAAALRGDVRAVLSHRPVTARRPTVAYRASRLARRHPLSTVLSGVVLVLVLVASVGGSGLAIHAMRSAEQRALSARRANLSAAFQALARHDTVSAVASLSEVPAHRRGVVWKLLDAIATGHSEALAAGYASGARQCEDGTMLLRGGHGIVRVDPLARASSRITLDKPAEFGASASWIDVSSRLDTAVAYHPQSGRVGLCTDWRSEGARLRFVGRSEMARPHLARLSPDGARLWIQETGDDALRLIDVSTSEVVRSWNTSGMTAASPSGAFVGVIDTNRELQVLGHDGSIVARGAVIAFGERVASLSDDGAFAVINARGLWRVIRTADGSEVSRVAAGSGWHAYAEATGRLAVVERSSIRVTDPGRAEFEYTLRGPQSTVDGVWFDRTGRFLMASASSKVHVWDLHASGVSAASLGGGAGHWMERWPSERVWRDANPVEVPTIDVPVVVQAISADGATIARCSFDGQLWLQDVGTPDAPPREVRLSDQAQHLAFLDTRWVIACVDAGGQAELTMIDAVRGAIEHSVSLAGYCEAIAVDPSGLIAVGLDDSLVVLDTELNETARLRIPEGGMVSAICAPSASAREWVVCVDGLTLWTLDLPKQAWTGRRIPASVDNFIRGCAWVTATELVVLRDASISVYDLSGREPELRFDGDPGVLDVNTLRMPGDVWALSSPG